MFVERKLDERAEVLKLVDRVLLIDFDSVVIKFFILVHLLLVEEKYLFEPPHILLLKLVPSLCLINHHPFSLLVRVLLPLPCYHPFLNFFVPLLLHLFFPLLVNV